MKLWEPSAARIIYANLTGFINEVSKRRELSFADPHAFYRWSIESPAVFWEEVWRFSKIISSKTHETVLQTAPGILGSKWFTGAKLNFAENLLRYRDDGLALVAWSESRTARRLTYRELYNAVASLADALRMFGVKSGDRVAGFVPNCPEAVIAMLAASSCGAIWSSCSPDFGVPGVLDRFGQIAPRILVMADGYVFKEKHIDCLAKGREIVAAIPSIERTLVIPFTADTINLAGLKDAQRFDEVLSSHATVNTSFVQLPFDHPLYIMYSSGTTGKPKCIVHGAGGTLLEHLKELLLHTDLKRQDRIFYQTTCGWMMWNWLVSSLAAGATVVLYDGSPFADNGRILFELAQKERVTIFGTNPKYLASVEKEGILAGKNFELKNLHSVLSTGSPLLPENFDFVYRDIKEDVCLSSIAGGTDIIGCFGLGSPLLPVYRGELQTRSLGLKVEVFDEAGRSLTGKKGELVCSAPFPSMPVGFWNDPGDARYRKAYFERFPGVWHHGDFVELTEHGGLIYYGRSDAVLNPGGVRIGTAEIYRQVETLSEISEALAVGQDWKGDVRVVLFVKLQSGMSLTAELADRIRSQIRANASPFHVPKKIIQVPDIPRTRSGKIVELAVRDIIHGLPVKNVEALSNPEVLELFRALPELGQE